MSCSKDATKLLTSDQNNATSLSYNLTENGCSTGNHSFNSQDELCNGLRDDSLNNNCAQNLRYQKFQTDCPGRAW